MFRNDWVRWGFGDDLKDFSKTEPFTMDYRGATSVPTRHPIEHAIDDARYLYETAGPISLMVSGGVDSQAMAYAFQQSGIPFQAYFARYEDDLNAHDFETSAFYRKHGIPVKEVPVNVTEFHRRELTSWAKKYRCNSPHILVHMKIASMLPGTVVSGGCITKPPQGQLTYSLFALERYSQISGQPVAGYFLQYSAELMASQYRLVEDGSLNREDYYGRKVALYRQGGFPVMAQTTKTHGFEKLKAAFDHHRVDTRTRLRYRGKNSARPYDLLFRYPLHDMIPYSEKTQTFYPDK